MTTTNYTDATLKGSVTGPTFTGNVDGAKFSGSVTSADTPIPPDPQPPTGPTGGRITAFSNALYGDTTIDGVNYLAQIVPSKTYAYTKVDDYTMRFEIRRGDTTQGSSGIDRSETECRLHIKDNTPVTVAYRIMCEAGSPNTANWMICGIEWHNDDSGLGLYTSPPIATELVGDKFSVVIRYPNNGNISSSGCTLKRLWTQPSNLVRGQWYVFETENKFSTSGGYLKVKLDGQQIINYSGPLGYGHDTYLMMGLYRNTVAETYAAKIKNMTTSWAK
jgi:polysaccharide lyase-like protein